MKKHILLALTTATMLASVQDTMPMWATLTHSFTSILDQASSRLTTLSTGEKTGAAVVILGSIAGVTYAISKIRRYRKQLHEAQQRQTNLALQNAKLQQQIKQSDKAQEDELDARTKIEKHVEEQRRQFATIQHQLQDDRAHAALAERELHQQISVLTSQLAEHQSAFKHAGQGHSSSMQELQGQHHAAISALETKIAQLQESIGQLHQHHQEELARIQEACKQAKEDEIATVAAQAKTQLAALKAEHAQQVQNLEQTIANMHERMQQDRQEFEQAITQLQAEHKSYIRTQGTALQARATDLKTQCQSLKNSVTSAFKDLFEFATTKLTDLTGHINLAIGSASSALKHFTNPRYNPFIKYDPTLCKQSLHDHANHLSTHVRCLQARDSIDTAQAAAASEEKATDLQPGMAVHYRITPPAQDCAADTKDDEPEKRILLISVHGTWAAQSGEFGSNPKSELSRAFKVFAQELAMANKQPVDFFVYQWKGHNTTQARTEGGECLAKFIEQYKTNHTDKDVTIWLIGHSHGGNVINYCAQQLKGKVKIDNAIFIATPVLEDNPHKDGGDGTYNISSLINIWGDADLTGSTGSWFVSGRQTTTLRHEHSYNPQKETVRNIRLKYKSSYLNHINVKHVAVRFLPLILNCISENFKIFYELVFNIYPVQKTCASGNGSGEQVATKTISHWDIHGAISDADRAYKLIQEAPQYAMLTTHDVQVEYMASKQFSESSKDNFKTIYGGYEILQKALSGYNIIDEIGSVFVGDKKLLGEIYGTHIASPRTSPSTVDSPETAANVASDKK